MSETHIVLASKSPRRKMLLESCGLQLVVRPVDIDESPQRGERPADYVSRLAHEKAHAALTACGQPHDVVIAADTVVAWQHKLLGKPASRGEALEMLSLLSGVEHSVFTGWMVASRRTSRSGVVETKVAFRHLQQREIERYVDSGEPFDKAGSYGIQGLGGMLVDHLTGSYTNVVGLPLKEVLAALEVVQRALMDGGSHA